MRKSVFLEFGPTTNDNDCARMLVYEAIKEGRIEFINVPDYFRDVEKYNRYVYMCRNHHRLAEYYDDYYFPKISKKDKYIFYFNEKHPALINKGSVLRLKEKYDVKAVLLIRNPLVNKNCPYIYGRSIEELKEEFDIVVTDEKTDAESYNLLYYPDTFFNAINEKFEIEYDLFFSGADKGRRRLLREIAKAADNRGLKTNINVVGISKIDKYIHYSNFVDYTEIMKSDLKSNCILEVLQQGQQSYTLRWQEAVCLNRKILTNNKNVIYEKYYDPKYVRIFETVDDIDWNFCGKKENVQYGYEDDFSSVKFFDFIENILENKCKVR